MYGPRDNGQIDEEHRSEDRIRAHYLLEKELSVRLRNGSPSERRSLYNSVYEELFTRIPDHPQWTERKSDSKRSSVLAQVRTLRPYLSSKTSFLEIGAGDCALALEVSSIVREALAVDVSDALVPSELPANCRFMRTDGVHLNIPASSVDLAYSYQVMEHLHPGDAAAQLRELWRVLSPNGVYFCITPNRLSGPHDISRYFGSTRAEGLHLREYSFGDLSSLFKAVGFRSIKAERVLHSCRLKISPLPLVLLEKIAELAPLALTTRIRQSFLFSRLIDFAVVGVKPS